MGSVVKGSFANNVYNQSEKWKSNLIDFRLILLDHITYLQKSEGQNVDQNEVNIFDRQSGECERGIKEVI